MENTLDEASKIAWTKKLETGIFTLDEHQKELCVRLQNFNDLLEKGGNCIEEAKEVMDFMRIFTIFHFDTEEKYMSKFGYPGHGEHTLMHLQLIEDFDKLDDFEEEIPEDELVLEVKNKILNWFSLHVEFDINFAQFIKGKIVDSGEEALE